MKHVNKAIKIFPTKKLNTLKMDSRMKNNKSKETKDTKSQMSKSIKVEPIRRNSQILESKLPKNANDYIHMIRGRPACKADIEYILILRNNKLKKNLSSLSSSPPSFYNEDLDKFTKKKNKFPSEKYLLQTNFGNFRQIFKDKQHVAINDSLYKFEVSLRTEGNTRRDKDINKSRNISLSECKKPWNNTNIHKGDSLIKYLLPPLLNTNKENFKKIEQRVSRPVITKYKEFNIEGKKIKQKYYEYDPDLSLRFPSEHLPSTNYNNEYGSKNLNIYQHLLKFDNKTMTSNWITNLRAQKKIVYNMNETKMREQKLRDRISKRNYDKY